jgi:lysylphosphatidylglycerol synthetase-like protein (DUF2156 family)
MGEDDQRDSFGGDRPPKLFGGIPSQRQTEYLAARPAYSLDRVLPPRKAQYIDGSPVAWMISGHAIWAVLLSWFAWGSSGFPWLVLALALALVLGHIVALVLVVVAWTSRARSVRAARTVAWVSTPLLATSVALLAVLWTVGALVLADDYILAMGLASPVLGVEFLGLVIVPLVLLSVATVGAFDASVSHARGLRGAERARTARVEDSIPN